MDFPYGKAPLAILIIAVVAAAALVISDLGRCADKPDLILATFTKEHAAVYRSVVKEFERANGVKVQIQVVDQRALQGRLESAMQVVPKFRTWLNCWTAHSAFSPRAQSTRSALSI